MGIGLVPGIILYLVLCIFLIHTFILSDTSSSPLARCFMETLPDYTLSLLRKVLGPKLVQKLQDQTQYFLVVVYLVVVLGSWSIMFTFGYSFITKSNHVSNWHKYSGYCVFVICMWSWRKASTTSPGYITARNIHRFDNYPYDDFLFIEKTCPTVGIRKLARSKYDRFTNQHVARFDHFCGWINNAVGEENYRFFLLFLAVHVGMCFYGTVLTWGLFVGEIEDRDLFNAIFFNGKTGVEVKADFWVVTHYMFMKHFWLSGVWILMTSMSVVLFLFLGFHLYIAANGMTTNEFYKWRQVKKWYKREKSRYEKALKEGKKLSTKPSSKGEHGSSNGGMKDLTNDVDVGCIGPINNNTVSEKQEEQKEQTEEEKTVLMDPGPPPVNIYNKGIVENFKEVFFPRSLRPDALNRYAKTRRTDQVLKSDSVNDNTGKAKAT
mmetsp:Transcript_10865/g.16424  ORF Transcript_10865/g.16424 Transcript_10865/m.16424 type:complete len:435 (-) Transcript_10865:115-1419(-)